MEFLVAGFEKCVESFAVSRLCSQKKNFSFDRGNGYFVSIQLSPSLKRLS